ncbi:hypothetical protein GJ496_009669 [Pomphorhynchus laevis]|nr:hypothetical protein GJ496_009669 [Pomphorhynchus laevis]
MNAFYTQSDLLRMLINKQNVNVICWSPPFCNFNPWRHCLLSEDNIGYQQSLSQISNYVFERRYNDRFKVSNKLILEQMNLPIKAYHNDIIQQCLNNQLLLIRGETGCGKSTQVAQYILDYFVDNGMGACCNILISEPRRLATLAISQRIAAERGEIVGETVGFRHRFESVLPRPYGSILVSTIGCALRRLKYGLNGISHVIIDEAHDNDADSDLICRTLIHQFDFDIWKDILFNSIFQHFCNTNWYLHFIASKLTIFGIHIGKICTQIGNTFMQMCETRILFTQIFVEDDVKSCVSSFYDSDAIRQIGTLFEIRFVHTILRRRFVPNTVTSKEHKRFTYLLGKSKWPMYRPYSICHNGREHKRFTYLLRKSKCPMYRPYSICYNGRCLIVYIYMVLRYYCCSCGAHQSVGL